ncbi:unnamed protein product [Leptidea sinapis]|uniref:Uncharacterized protein n=2 Tax=Leptidea sinapis TaxID=189913 RepID=A0A5E4PMV3_9NEOP|nr:unnamed protein product [Leptidea sinapis]
MTGTTRSGASCRNSRGRAGVSVRDVEQCGLDGGGASHGRAAAGCSPARSPARSARRAPSCRAPEQRRLSGRLGRRRVRAHRGERGRK